MQKASSYKSDGFQNTLLRNEKLKRPNARPLCESSKAVVRRCSVINVLSKISKYFTGKHLCWSLFFNKVAGLPRISFFLRTHFLQNTYVHLLLKIHILGVLKTSLLYRTPPAGASPPRHEHGRQNIILNELYFSIVIFHWITTSISSERKYIKINKQRNRLKK